MVNGKLSGKLGVTLRWSGIPPSGGWGWGWGVGVRGGWSSNDLSRFMLWKPG